MMDWKVISMIKLVALKKDKSLRFESRLVYSCLVCRDGLTPQRCSDLTRLCVQTVRKTLAVLVRDGWATKDENRYTAAPRPEDVATWGDPSRTWRERVCYEPYYVPSPINPLVAHHLAVFSQLVKGKTTSTEGIARLLRMSPTTVRRAKKALRAHGLLDPVDHPTVSPDKQSWWRRKKTRPIDLLSFSDEFGALADVLGKETQSPPDLIRAALDEAGRVAAGAGYHPASLRTTIVKAIKAAQTYRAMYALVCRIPVIMRQAEAATAANRATEGYQGCSAGYFTHRVMAVARQERDRVRQEHI
jgi:hypothetical protein